MYRGGAGYAYHADGLGSIVGLTDANGNVAASYTYDSFGNLTASTGTVTNPYRYTAREFDTETGMYYYRARYYLQGVGRFASEDRIQFIGGIDLYTYVSNNPARLIDPLGLAEITFDTTYTVKGFWQSWWHAGDTILGKPELSATCDCIGGGRYKLNAKIRFPIRVYYSGPLTRSHEEKHVKVAEDFFRRQRGRYEAFEQTYASAVECEYYRQKYVTGFRNSGRTPDLMDAILKHAESGELGSLQESVDNWFDRLIFH